MSIRSWAAARSRSRTAFREEFYEKEREHVFKKTWLYMGRVERVPRSGSYFTRELKFLNTSIIIVRGKDDVIRAMPQHLPAPRQQNAVGGRPLPRRCRAGAVAVLPFPRLALQPGRLAALADPQGSAARLRCRQLPGAGDSMRSLGRLHLHQPQPATTPSRCAIYLGELAHGIEGYPFDGPHQVYRFKAELQCNWKIFVDGFAESYHGPYLHASSFGPSPRRPGRRSTSRTRSPTRWPTGSRVRTGCSPSPASRRRRRRTPSRSSA